jgi:hypothetical protein
MLEYVARRLLLQLAKNRVLCRSGSVIMTIETEDVTNVQVDMM